MRLDLPPSEARRLLAGARLFRKLAGAADTRQVGISVFSAASCEARVGRTSRYSLSICNLGPDTWADLHVDFLHRQPPEKSADRRCVFKKAIFLPARQEQPIGISFDWKSSASFQIDDVSFDPDNCLPGPCSLPGPHVIRAELLLKNEPCDHAELVQTLLR
jgi:hypothetical protein